MSTIEFIDILVCAASNGAFPNCAVYDDGCHLVEFLRNHLGHDLRRTSASEFLANIKFSVDRVHFKNHVGKWCRRHMNPDDNRCKLDKMKYETFSNTI